MFKMWRQFLKRLEEANKKEFGNQRLDCCGLNRQPNQGQASSSNPKSR